MRWYAPTRCAHSTWKRVAAPSRSSGSRRSDVRRARRLDGNRGFVYPDPVAAERTYREHRPRHPTPKLPLAVFAPPQYWHRDPRTKALGVLPNSPSQGQTHPTLAGGTESRSQAAAGRKPRFTVAPGSKLLRSGLAQPHVKFPSPWTPPCCPSRAGRPRERRNSVDHPGAEPRRLESVESAKAVASGPIATPPNTPEAG